MSIHIEIRRILRNEREMKIEPGRAYLYLINILGRRTSGFFEFLHEKSSMRFCLQTLSLLTIFVSAVAQGATFRSPVQGHTANSVFGALNLALSTKEDTLLDIARVYDVGYREIKIANPKIDVLLPGDNAEILIPSMFILPRELRQQTRPAIVINVAEFRLYHHQAVSSESAQVATYPISIGRQEWQTPHGVTKIVAKAKDPAWYPPESVRAEHEEWGDPLPEIVPPGEDNPLGNFALRLGIPGYLIHGTNRPYGIGMRVTHGCVRMYPQDVEKLFYATRVGTRVTIINRPVKLGRFGNDLYLEVHPLLEGDKENEHLTTLSGVVDYIATEMDGAEIKLDWELLKATLQRRSGIPTVIGAAIPPTEPAVASAP